MKPVLATTPSVIIFAKAPTPGTVKTRLLSVVSADEAATLYQCLVRDTLEVVKGLRTLRCVIAYAADRCFPDLTWLDGVPTCPATPARPEHCEADGGVAADRQPMFFQHGSTLGERLVHAFTWAFEQGARPVVALGSDAPELSRAWIRRAFQELTRREVVVGPTVDGGYQLIGLRKPQPELFADMPWSTPRLFRQTLARINELRLGASYLEPIADLDTPEDLRRFMAQSGFRHQQSHTARYLRNTLRFPGAPVRSSLGSRT